MIPEYAGIQDFTELRDTIAKLPEDDMHTALLALFDASNNKLDQARKNIEARFDNVMDRVSGWYKRQAQAILLVLAVIVSGAMSADTITLTASPWRKKLKLDWDIERCEAAINAIVNMHKRLAEATGGKPWVPRAWTILKNLVTPHPIGGCNFGTTEANGVVNHRGEVFGYPNLFVADGAIIPEAVGLNPSKTIAALAERIVDVMPD